MTLLVGTLTAQKIRVVTTWNGPWFAEAEVELGDTDVAPTGKATVTVGTTVLVGTVDPRGSGRMGSTAFLRVVAGGGGWDKPVPALEWHNDSGVTSTVVLQATAAVVGETVVDSAPAVLGLDWARIAGPASRALGSRPWYVDGNGITQVGPRPPSVAPDDLLVQSWDPAGEVVGLATDTLLLPGLSLTDDRWDGAIVVRDIEQTFDGEGSTATAICSATAISRAQAAFRNAVVEASGVAFARSYRFRVVQQGGDGRLTLQAVAKAPGAPDSQLLVPWYGVPGLSAKVTPGMLVLVEYPEGDPSLSAVKSFDGTSPLELDAVATTKVTVTAPEIDLAATAKLAVTAGEIDLTASGSVVVAGNEIDLNASTVKAGGSGAVAMADVINDWAKLVTAAINGLVPGTIPGDLACASTTLTAGAPEDPFGAGS